MWKLLVLAPAFVLIVVMALLVNLAELSSGLAFNVGLLSGIAWMLLVHVVEGYRV